MSQIDEWNDVYRDLVVSNETLKSKLSKAILNFEENVLVSGNPEAAKMILKFLYMNADGQPDLLLSTLDKVLSILRSRFDDIPKDNLLKVDVRLQILSEKPVYQFSFPLQKMRHRIAHCHNDPFDTMSFIDRFNSTKDIKYRLTTNSLMDLKKFHDLLAVNKCCAENVPFLRYYLKMLIFTTKDDAVKGAMSYAKAFDILENVRTEIYKVLYCLYGFELTTRSVEKHERSSSDFIQLGHKDCTKLVDFFTSMNLKTSFESNIFDLDIAELEKKIHSCAKNHKSLDLNTCERDYLTLANTLALTQSDEVSQLIVEDENRRSIDDSEDEITIVYEGPVIVNNEVQMAPTNEVEQNVDPLVFSQQNDVTEREGLSQLSNSQADDNLTRLQEQRRKSMQLIIESDDKICELKIKRVKSKYEILISEFKNTISSLEQDNVQLKEQVVGFENETKELKGRVVGFEHETKELKGQIGVFEQNINALNNQLSHSKKEVSTLKERSALMETQLDEIEQENEKLIHLLEQKAKEIKDDNLKRKRARMSNP